MEDGSANVLVAHLRQSDIFPHHRHAVAQYQIQIIILEPCFGALCRLFPTEMVYARPFFQRTKHLAHFQIVGLPERKPLKHAGAHIINAATHQHQIRLQWLTPNWFRYWFGIEYTAIKWRVPDSHQRQAGMRLKILTSQNRDLDQQIWQLRKFPCRIGIRHQPTGVNVNTTGMQ